MSFLAECRVCGGEIAFRRPPGRATGLLCRKCAVGEARHQFLTSLEGAEIVARDDAAAAVQWLRSIRRLKTAIRQMEVALGSPQA